ncbi:ribokinase-like [Leptidea sinapis]|uniref:ribokinase-like n=1 Tax=Leptidea sinapis TaxID=189913 RepID=UPI00212E8BC4|nr:ribokinase-like [Leptidea sinapis]
MEPEKSKPKIVVLASCCVDFITYAPRLPLPGETLQGDKFTTGFGGKGANQCVAAAKLGGDCHIICRIGDDDWGIKYKENLISFGIDVTHAKITKGVSTGIAQISVAANGENHIVIVPGANKYLSTCDVEEAKVLVENADILISQLETPLETTYEAFKLCRGIKLLNAAPANINIVEILKYCTLLCVNEVEASMLVEFEVTISNIKHALQKLLLSGCKVAVITLGEKGAAYSSEEGESIFVPCKKVTPKDTTGAGDAFVGALAKFMVSHRDYPLHQIIGAACDVATKSVTKEGTQISFPEKYDAFNEVYKYTIL